MVLISCLDGLNFLLIWFESYPRRSQIDCEKVSKLSLIRMLLLVIDNKGGTSG